MRQIFVVTVLAAACFGANAAAALDTDKLGYSDPARFERYEDNYALFANWMRNNGWAGDDERALRAHYSFRYALWGNGIWDAALSYTGEFDFYLNTRPSGPVINRLSNPAVRLRYAPAWAHDGSSKQHGSFELSFEHASDGQTTEVTSASDAAKAQCAYLAMKRSFFDTISRGSNFVSLGADFPEDTAGLPVSVRAKLRFYTDQDSAVTWGPLAGQGVKLSDYNRLSVRVGKETVLGGVELQWTVGDKGTKTDSFDLGWQVAKNWPLLPVYVRYHRGPLNTLSNYTQRQDSIGIGLRFADF